MGGSDMPYLYPNTQSSTRIAYPYSDYNPKSVTEASYERLSQQSQPKPKQEGPLINFNQHPDSYVLFSGEQKEFKPLPKGTKKAVVSVRWVQFALRIMQEICALGLLTTTICIRGTAGAETYLLRIPQAWDSLIGLYAIYHLVRPAKARMPGSSASYHTFALIMDTSLIPLYVYIALLVNNNRQLPIPQYSASGELVEGDWRWSSFFPAQWSTDLLLLVTYIGATVIGGLHLVSCGLDVYLIIAFRQIANLPPDMNPLEDNLTSRRIRKHKHKNSELTLTGNQSTSEVETKKLAYLSGSTLSVGNASRVSIAKSIGNDDRSVPFNSSRTGSTTNLAFSPHNPESARWSRHQYEGQQNVYQQAIAEPRRSRYEVRPDGKLEVRSRRGSQSPSKREPTVMVESVDITAAERTVFETPSKHSVFVESAELQDGAYLDSPSMMSRQAARTASPAVSNAARSRATTRSEQKEQLLNDNWYVLDAPDPDESEQVPPPKHPARSPPAHYGRHGYKPVYDRHDSFEPAGFADQRTLMPLGMHPPTPPMPEDEYSDPLFEQSAGVKRSLTAASKDTNSSSVYSESAPSLKSSAGHARSDTPKSKYYGDLAAAQRGIRNGGAGGYGLPPSPQLSRTPSPEKQARVISRTGADIADESVLYVSEGRHGMRSRRDVSGKVAEEGRGSWGRRA
ncbi:hypothetical protein BAUCODRAFT_34239 [Baudoinia panamericana UAMH 10762]|uniref:Uncharacterized protein n=1 Tax=Baudoinia panamericana (strain UAMH 10762) TaxID=717646 RepID=M2ND42_BAUPA|nr:uncharacterized protein BAUCODRAFT_34239 [Baudoinia panamericana UAMH 10762]EMC96840.1 hypothetical protein BAUCODRAFT_34239 [Baudoinia panamericana UAMH 10762]